MKESTVQTRPRSLDRIAVILVTGVGMAMCSAGIGRVAAVGAWLGAQGIVGTFLGAATLGIVATRLLGKTLPGINSDRTALLAVVTIAVVKFAIAAVVPL